MKAKIKEKIFRKIDYDKPIPFSEIKDIVKDDDTILAGWDDGFYSENNSIDGHYYLTITRVREETDDEYEKRVNKTKKLIDEARNRRYQNYLKLKKEFENDGNS